MQTYTQNEIFDLIKNSGLKYTEHRFNILMRVSKSKSSIAAHKLIEDMKKKYDIDQATVYRNLISLEEAGIIKKSSHKVIGSSHGHAHYEVSTDEVFQKVICNKCETIEKISSKNFNFDDVLKKIIKKSKKFKTGNVLAFEIYGLCNGCA